MTEETEEAIRCPKCGYRGYKEELVEGCCPACGWNIGYMMLDTKKHGLHRRIRGLLRKGMTPTQIHRTIPCSRSTVYRVKKKEESLL